MSCDGYRYKLASVTNREASTQTQEIDLSENRSTETSSTLPIMEALKIAREDIIRLQQERDEERKQGTEKSKLLKKESEVGHVTIM